MLSLAHLKTFLTVCRLGSFTKAAHELNLTQPAVSGHIASLEDEVGMKLFDRTGKKIVLTDAGEVVLRSARSIFSRIENMRNELEDLRSSGGVTIRVGASKLTGIYMMPGIFVAFRDRFPDLDMQVAIHAPHTIVGQLEENACDLAIVGEGETILPPSIGKMKIGEDRLTLIVSPEHPLVKKQKFTLEDAAGENMILPGSRDASLQSFRVSLKKLGIRSVEMNDAEAVKSAVASGSGLAVVSRSAVRHELEDGRLAELKAEECGQLCRGIFMLWRLDGRLSKNAEAFMHFLQEAFADKGPDGEKPHDSQ